MKRKKRTIIISVVCSLIVAICIVSTIPFIPFLKNRFLLYISRPKEAYLMPNFSKEVTDVRVTIVQRDINPRAAYGKYYSKDGNVLQIFYGYLSDGEWIDIPYENYDLRDLSEKSNQGFEATSNPHAVVMGSYILLAFPVQTDTTDVISDTVFSEIIEITEYYYQNSMESQTPNYFLREDMVLHGSAEYRCWLGDYFHKWYYIVLEAENIPDDYSITLSSYDKKTNELMDEYTYTYDDIMEALNRE